MASVRKFPNGTHQATIKNKYLKALTGLTSFYVTRDTPEEAMRDAEAIEAKLKVGIVPDELLPENKAKRGGDRVSEAIKVGAVASNIRLLQIVNEYCAARRVSPSDDKIYSLLIKETNNPLFSEMTLQWAERLVADYKSEKVMMAPSTIRKRIGALSRAMDWYQSKAKVPHPIHYGKSLGRGYSHYANGEKIDVSRERFYKPGEEAKVLALFNGEVELKPQDVQRLEDVTSPIFYRLYTTIRHTGMRLKEAYWLRVEQIDFAKNLIQVDGTKGHYGAIKKRHVPMKPIVREVLAQATEGKQPTDLVFPYWSGKTEEMQSASNYLSVAFARLFKAAGVTDMREHDLRHQATIDWVSMKSKKTGNWLFQESELLQMMGWSNRAMLDRYIKGYRADDLASRLDEMAA